ALELRLEAEAPEPRVLDGQPVGLALRMDQLRHAVRAGGLGCEERPVGDHAGTSDRIPVLVEHDHGEARESLRAEGLVRERFGAWATDSDAEARRLGDVSAGVDRTKVEDRRLTRADCETFPAQVLPDLDAAVLARCDVKDLERG